MPFIPAIIGAIAASGAVGAAAIGAGATVASGALASRSANKAAKAQTDAANYAADQQLKANREALAFQERQAQRADLLAETNRRANYDMWAASAAHEGAVSDASRRQQYDIWASGQRRLGTVVGRALGLGPREVPGYVPTPGMTIPGYVAGSSLTAGTGAGLGSVNGYLTPAEAAEPAAEAKRRSLRGGGLQAIRQYL